MKVILQVCFQPLKVFLSRIEAQNNVWIPFHYIHYLAMWLIVTAKRTTQKSISQSTFVFICSNVGYEFWLWSVITICRYIRKCGHNNYYFDNDAGHGVIKNTIRVIPKCSRHKYKRMLRLVIFVTSQFHSTSIHQCTCTSVITLWRCHTVDFVFFIHM